MLSHLPDTEIHPPLFLDEISRTLRSFLHNVIHALHELNVNKITKKNITEVIRVRKLHDLKDKKRVQETNVNKYLSLNLI